MLWPLFKGGQQPLSGKASSFTAPIPDLGDAGDTVAAAQQVILEAQEPGPRNGGGRRGFSFGGFASLAWKAQKMRISVF